MIDGIDQDNFGETAERHTDTDMRIKVRINTIRTICRISNDCLDSKNIEIRVQKDLQIACFELNSNDLFVFSAAIVSVFPGQWHRRDIQVSRSKDFCSLNLNYSYNTANESSLIVYCIRKCRLKTIWSK